MAYTFLSAEGYNVGNSLLDEESLEFCREMIDKYPSKLIIPIDSVNALEISEHAEIRTSLVNEINDDEIGLDIGPRTLELFKKYINKSKTIFWNGTMGYSEISIFSTGTKKLCEILKKSHCEVIIGGGDTGGAVINFGYGESFKHISTGGGASLKLLEGNILPGISIIDNR